MKNSYLSVLHSHKVLMKQCPCGIYMVDNCTQSYSLVSHIQKMSKIIFIGSVIKDIQYLRAISKQGNFDVPIFEVNRICVSFRLFKSNLPCINTSDRVFTVFGADQLIYFIRLEAMVRTCVSPFFVIMNIIVKRV